MRPHGCHRADNLESGASAVFPREQRPCRQRARALAQHGPQPPAPIVRPRPRVTSPWVHPKGRPIWLGTFTDGRTTLPASITPDSWRLTRGSRLPRQFGRGFVSPADQGRGGRDPWPDALSAQQPWVVDRGGIGGNSSSSPRSSPNSFRTNASCIRHLLLSVSPWFVHPPSIAIAVVRGGRAPVAHLLIAPPQVGVGRRVVLTGPLRLEQRILLTNR